MSRSCDALVLEGAGHSSLAIVRNLGERGVRVATGAETRIACAAASRYSSEFLLYPSLTDDPQAAAAVVCEFARRHPGIVIFPNSDRWHLLSYQWRERLEAAGAVLAVAQRDAFRSICDKGETLERARRLGVPIPPTYLPKSPEAFEALRERLTYPLVVKTRISVILREERFFDTIRTQYVRTPDETRPAYDRAHAQVPDPILQNFVPGRGMGVFLLCDRGRPLLRFAHRRVRDVVPTGSASCLRESVAYPEKMGADAERLAADLQWTGPMMVEFRADEPSGQYYLMEINGGRFWGSLQLAIDAGCDFPFAWYQLVRGQSVAATAGYRIGIRSRWMLGDIQNLIRTMRGRPQNYSGEFPTRSQALASFFLPTGHPTRLELFRWSDPLPAAYELAYYARRLLGGTT